MRPAGCRNGYFDALHPADGLVCKDSPHPHPDLLRLWTCTQLGAARQSQDSLQPVLLSCALQRLDTLHEQLLHLRYTCALTFAQTDTHTVEKPTDAETDAPTDGSPTDAQTDSPTLAQSDAPRGGDTGAHTEAVAVHSMPALSTHQVAGPGPPVDVDADAQSIETTASQAGVDSALEAAVQQELEQLSQQVLRFAGSAVGVAGLPGESPQSGEVLSSGRLLAVGWQQAADRLPLLATYASQPCLQVFMQALLQSAFCSAQNIIESSVGAKDITNSSVASTTAEAAAILRWPQLWQHANIQEAWVQAMLALLAQQHLSVQTGKKDAEPAAKHRKAVDAHQREDAQLSHALVLVSPIEPSAEDLDGLNRLMQATCASAHAHLKAAVSNDAPSAAPLQPRSNAQTAKASKKRKSSQLSTQALHSSSIDQQQQQQQQQQHHFLIFCRVQGLLQHAAEVAAQQLAAEGAEPLALLMLQAQAWLTPHLLAAEPSSAAQPDAADPVAAPSAGMHACTDIPTPQLALVLLRCLVTTQAVLARCLKVAPDGVAVRLLLQLPASWQLLAATNQQVWQVTTQKGDTQFQQRNSILAL